MTLAARCVWVGASADCLLRAADVALWEDRSPATLERFLRARDYDVAVASELFLEHRAWRKSLGWRVTGDRVPPSQFEERKIALQARSRAGAPLLIIIASRHNKCDRNDSLRPACVTQL